MNRKAPTYSGTDLLREVQMAALEEWNSDPKLPAWDCQGRAVVRVAGLPVGVLYYLEEATPTKRSAKASKALEAFNSWRTTQSRSALQRGGEAEDEVAERLLRAAPFQVNQARAWLDSMRPALERIDGRPVLDDPRLRDVVSHMEAVLSVLAAMPRAPKDDGVLRDLIYAGLTEWLGRKPSNREAALASVLCGTEVFSARMTVAQAIGKERLAMQQAGLRAKKRVRP